MPLSKSEIQESFSCKDADVKTLIPSILKLNLQQEFSEKDVINSLNKQLAKPKYRLEALEMINVLIPNCSKNLIPEIALNWLNYCLVTNKEDNLKEIKLVTIGNIIEYAYNNQEFTKRFISEYIAKNLDCCISIHENSQETEAALKTLSICLKRYASWFNIHKVKIENFLLMFLDNPSEILVKHAGVAYLHFQQIGGAGIDGINYKQNFSSAFHKLCVTLHKLFDVFFENEVEIEQYDVEDENSFAFINVSYDAEKILHLTTRRIRNCISFLKSMLLKGFPVTKEIMPTDILGVISRGTSLHKCLSSDTEKSFKEHQFSLLLTNIQTDLLQLLRILLVWLQIHSLPFTYTISKVLIDCLNRSQNCKCFESNRKFQEIIYKTLIEWIRCVKCSLHVRFQTQLLDCILKNITPLKNEISLSVSSTSVNKSNTSKKKSMLNRIIAHSQQNSNSLSFSNAEREAQIRICSRALDTLKELLNYTRLKIDAKKLEEFYSVIIENLLQINSYKFCHPYTDLNCQEKLYDVLVAFYEQESLSVLPPISLSINILNKGMVSKDRNVRFICERGLNILEKLCQPVCPSMYIPEMFGLTNISTNAKQIVTEDNESYEMELEGYDNDEEETEEMNVSFDKLEIIGEPQKPIHLNLEINDQVTIEIDKNHKSNDVITRSSYESDQQDVENESSQNKNVSINVIDVQVLETAVCASDDEASLSGTETVSFENYVKEESRKGSGAFPNEEIIEVVSDSVEEAQLTSSVFQEPSVVLTHSSDPEETFERPSKISKLDVDVESQSEEALTIDFKLSDDEFVDEVKDY